jgi:leucyl/phenylalanyl-tRNA--protein transferase
MLESMAREPNQCDELLVPFELKPQPLPPDIRLSPPRFFPSPTATTPEGLLCVGGRLSPEWLLDAYSHGIFPWPMWDDDPIAWWSPDPRAIIELAGLHVSRRLQRTLRSGKFHVTCDRDFAGVIRGCATAGDRKGNTWLTSSMIDAYCQMHDLGHAHSIEVWQSLTPRNDQVKPALSSRDGRRESAASRQAHPASTSLTKGEGRRLVGGTYGVAVGGLFAAESKFHRTRDASKVAVAHLVAHLASRGYELLDIQQWTPHTGRLGAVELSRIEYLRRLERAVERPVTFGEELAGKP